MIQRVVSQCERAQRVIKCFTVIQLCITQYFEVYCYPVVWFPCAFSCAHACMCSPFCDDERAARRREATGGNPSHDVYFDSASQIL